MTIDLAATAVDESLRGQPAYISTGVTDGEIVCRWLSKESAQAAMEMFGNTFYPSRWSQDSRESFKVRHEVAPSFSEVFKAIREAGGDALSDPGDG